MVELTYQYSYTPKEKIVFQINQYIKNFSKWSKYFFSHPIA